MVYDDNHITIDGDTAITFTDDSVKRFEAYGWHVIKADPYDHAALTAALEAAVAALRSHPLGERAAVIGAIAAEVKDLAERAKGRALKGHEITGSTFTVSNLGMFGVKQFAAIVNPPHATILAVGAGEQRPVVKNGQLSVATVITVTFSTDHRAVDGALGAELLSALKGLIENPVSMLV